MRRTALLLSVVVCLGCGSDEQPSSPEDEKPEGANLGSPTDGTFSEAGDETDSVPSVSAPPRHALLGKPAPTFSLALLEGGQMDLEKHRGNDVVILDFWATWCPPCRAGLPAVAATAEKFQDRNVVFYAVNLTDDDRGETPEKVRAFLDEMGLSIQVAMDNGAKVASTFNVAGIPQTVIVGKDGTVQVVHVGFSPDLEQTLTDELTALLEGKDLAAEAL
ncbi:MAG: TlpA family protein disulfide reductase [Planctomycetota bacterium]